MCSVDIGLHRRLYMQSWCHSLSNDFAQISCKAKACSRIGSRWRSCFKMEVIRLCLCVNHKYFTLLQTITLLLRRDAYWSLVLLGCSRKVDGQCPTPSSYDICWAWKIALVSPWVVGLSWLGVIRHVYQSFSYCLWCCIVCSLKVLISLVKILALIGWL